MILEHWYELKKKNKLIYVIVLTMLCGCKITNQLFDGRNKWHVLKSFQSPYKTLFIFQAEIARQEARLKTERENLEKEKSVLMGTASNQDNQDGALEITVSGEKYRCLRFSKAKKWGILEHGIRKWNSRLWRCSLKAYT